jgi:magnesium transporter
VNAELLLARTFVDSHPARAAVILERMTEHRASRVLAAMPPRSAATVLAAMTAPLAARTLSEFEDGQATAVLGAMPMDGAAAILRAVAADRRDQLLAALPVEEREPLARALRYPEGTAGSVMDPSVLRLQEGILVAEAQTRLRRSPRELLFYLYVEDRDHRLVGVLDIPELMLARPRDPVSAAMHREVERLSAWMPVALVREHWGWSEFHAMPVVDEHDRLVGAIRYQMLRRLEREAARERNDPSQMTALALGELFRVGTTGLVAGVGTSGSPDDEPHARGAADSGREVADA